VADTHPIHLVGSNPGGEAECRSPEQIQALLEIHKRVADGG